MFGNGKEAGQDSHDGFTFVRQYIFLIIFVVDELMMLVIEGKTNPLY